MSAPVNLGRERKRRAREDARRRADENAARHGRTKAQRRAEADAAETGLARLDAHRREPRGDAATSADGDGPGRTGGRRDPTPPASEGPTSRPGRSSDGGDLPGPAIAVTPPAPTDRPAAAHDEVGARGRDG